MLLLPLPCRNRPPPLDDVNNFRHHCRYQRRAAPVVIHIDRNALFTSSEYALKRYPSVVTTVLEVFWNQPHSRCIKPSEAKASRVA
jgi:hypothetical protein